MTPQHALFKELYEVLPFIEKTFDYLPDAKTKYPFIFIGETYDSEQQNFDLIGNVEQVIHVYGLRTQRVKLEQIASKIHNLTSMIKHTEHYSYAMTSHTSRIIPDNTDVQPLLHYVITLNFRYNKNS